MKFESLHDVLVDNLRDLYHAEKQLVKALPRLARAANTAELQEALEEHLGVTEGHVERLEKVFEELGVPARAKTCAGMQGLVEEGKEVLEAQKESEPDAFDAALIVAAQKVEHYEISAYGSCRAHAEMLGLQRVAQLLQTTLDEESEANETLTQIAESVVNSAASSADHGEAGDEDEDAEKTKDQRRSASGASRGRSEGGNARGSRENGPARKKQASRSSAARS